jgi:enterochelin esterase-like enzyme
VTLGRLSAWRRAASVAVVLAACAVPAAIPPSVRAAPSAPTVAFSAFHSRALDGTLHYAIALPPGYDTSGERYPVVYFLHGLPANDQAYRSIRGLAASLAARGHDAIVVGAQGARIGDTDPEWRDWGPGRNWETATASELVSWIDGHYRTIARRSGRAIVGMSAGGYGAMLIGIHHPATYQVIESWSGYFEATGPSGKPLDLGSPKANDHANAHVAVPTLKREFSRYPKTYVAFFIGNRDPYPGFVADNRQLDREFTQAGIEHTFRIYDGAHNQTFWGMHQDDWLEAAVTRLDPPG